MQQAKELLKKLRAAYEKKEDDLGLKLLAQLKLFLLEFSALPPATPAAPTAPQREELEIAREVLEYGALLSIRTVDIPSFERHVAQLKIYYTDCASTLEESPRQYPLLGLNLLRLLAQNRIAEFHTELETLPTDLQTTNDYIKFPAQLEQNIMEGSYNRVLSAKQSGLYAQEGMYFMDMLVDMVREEIAECSEKAYDNIVAGDLQTLLMLSSSADLNEYAAQRKWSVSAGDVRFGKGDAETLFELPARKLISETLAYAKELERIV